jgi:hypothetical protein
MTVDDLRAKLSEIEGDKEVFVYWDDEKSETHFFAIDGVSVEKGMPKNLPDGKVGFEFKHDGPAEWALIEVSQS